jgi:hypothetical protein
VPALVVADEGFYLSELQGRRFNPHLLPQYSLSSFLRMLNMFQVVIWKEPAILAIGHLPIFYEKSRVVMQDGDMRDERVLRTIVGHQTTASSWIDRIAYFSIIGRSISTFSNNVPVRDRGELVDGPIEITTLIWP